MTARRAASDTGGALGALVHRVGVLERANPLASASLLNGRARVLDAAGNPQAVLGHAGGVAGFLIPSGGSYVTVQTWVGQQIAASEAVSNFRLDFLESFANNYGPRVGALEGDVSSLSGRATFLEAFANLYGPRVDGHTSLIGAAQSAANAAQATANGRVTQAQLGSLANIVSAVIDFAATVEQQFSDHMQQYHQTRPLRPTPPSKPGVV